MDIDTLVDALIKVGRTGDPYAAASLPGAGVHSQVVQVASYFRRATVLDKIAALPVVDRISFSKALAVYEDSVGGMGSVTALQYVMRLFDDAVEQGYETFSWICANTRSLWYYSSRAVEFMEPEIAAERRAIARSEVERRNYELAEPARVRRAARATDSLYNAVRRGDLKAVQALLAKGADPTISTPTDEPLVEFAQTAGSKEIANLLEAARGNQIED
jgi:hypothetical protein